MPFFKDLRRRSKASFHTSKSNDSKSNGSHCNGGGMTSGKSSSTIDTASYKSVTPPSSIKPNRSSPNLQLPSLSEFNNHSEGSSSGPLNVPPPRSGPFVSNLHRNSTIGSSSQSVNGGIRSPTPSSPYSPRIISISDTSWVHQRVLLVYGQIGDPRSHPLDGSITVSHHQDSFPPVGWPVTASHFKALVHLVPGPNRLRFDFMSPKLSSGSIHPSSHSTWICINYLPLVNSPPLHLAILLGKDSDGTFDATPERIQREGNGLETAIRKYRTAAYLWQAFTGEQMFRNNFGRRCFRFEEEWQGGTLSRRDAVNGQMRNEAKIHVVRTDKTVAELRDLDIAQQYGDATKKDELFNIAKAAVQGHFQLRPGQKQYVSVMLLDSHWDKESQVIRGHAALGSSGDNLKMAIFGSHNLQSYPSNLEEVVDAFSDCSPTDTEFVANDCGEAGSSWEAANIGIGAHLHEVGHLFGCPHQDSGVMLRDYVRLNRSFMTREPFSTRTKTQGPRLCLPSDECGWHRLDALRFRFHSCFRLPGDHTITSDDSVQVWPVENGKILFTAASGIAFLELYSEGDNVCRSFIEYLNTEASSNGLPKQITVTESELRQRLFGTEKEKKKKVSLEVFSGGLGSYSVDDVSNLKSKLCLVKLPKGQSGYRGGKLGFSQLDGSQPEQVLLDCAFTSTKLLTSIKVYHGLALDGLEFFYEDATSQLFGKRGGKPGGDEFVLDTRRGEILLGFYIRAGLWIDGIEILTSQGRKSGVFGNAQGGSGHTLIPPLGYKVAGISGSCGSWIDGKNSQKPNQELIHEFQEAFGDIVPPTTTSNRDAGSMEQANNDPTRRGFNNEMVPNDMTPTAMQSFRFTPFLDPNALSYMPSATQPTGYYTPNSGQLGTAFPNRLGDLQQSTIPLDMMTPLALPNQLVGGSMDTNMNGFDQQYQPQYQASNQFPQQTTFAPSAFVNHDSGYGTMDDPAEQMRVKDLDMQEDSWVLGTQASTYGQQDSSDAEATKFRYNATLRAPTAMTKYQDIPVTYLNKGQAYSLSIVDSEPPAQPAKYRTYVRVSFEEEEQRSKPATCWQLWKEGRGLNEAHQRDGKLQAVEYVDQIPGANEDYKHRQVQLESASFDGFCVTWTSNPSPGAFECAIPVRFYFLSTDFSHSKGVKGIPVRLCAKTEIISPTHTEANTMVSNPEVCYCQVKLFRDHGAERKLSNDVAHVKKTIEKLKQQMAQAEMGPGGYGKRKRSFGSIGVKGHDDRPTKVTKPRRRWSSDSRSNGSGKMSLEDDLHAKLEMMQDMFTSTRQVSALNLRGDEQDDPDLSPVHLPGGAKGAKKMEDAGEFQEPLSVISPNSSVVSLNSPHHPMRSQLAKFEFDSGFQGSLEGSREQSRPCSESAMDKQHQNSPVKISRAQTVSTVQHPGGYIEAMDVDPTYRPPTRHLPKPVACFYIRFPHDAQPDGYYRAVYLNERSVSDLIAKICHKQQINPDRVGRMVHAHQNGMKVLLDDDVIEELPDGQDMVAEFSEVPSPDGFPAVEVTMIF